MAFATRLLGGLIALFGFLFALHYALFGALPIGTPKLLESNDEGDEDA